MLSLTAKRRWLQEQGRKRSESFQAGVSFYNGKAGGTTRESPPSFQNWSAPTARMSTLVSAFGVWHLR